MLKRRWRICAGWASAGRRARTRVVRYAPYVQSKRRSLYLAAWRKLLHRGCLFPCRCSRKDLETALGAPHERVQAASAGSKLDILDDEPMYPGTCRHLTGHAPQLPGPTVGGC